jgi:RNA polymerase sigma-70 factor (ECF subfamily)
MPGEQKQGSGQPVPASDLILAGKFRDALAACIREHGAALGRYCMAVLGSQLEAEEAVQQTLGMAYDAMPFWQGDTKVRTWLFSLARRICIRRVEARSSLPPGPRYGEDATAEEAASEDMLRKRKRARTVRYMLSRLRPAERDVVILRYQSGLSYGEIAFICGVAEDDIRTQASRALLRLREFVKELRAE